MRPSSLLSRTTAPVARWHRVGPAGPRPTGPLCSYYYGGTASPLSVSPFAPCGPVGLQAPAVQVTPEAAAHKFQRACSSGHPIGPAGPCSQLPVLARLPPMVWTWVHWLLFGPVGPCGPRVHTQDPSYPTPAWPYPFIIFHC